MTEKRFIRTIIGEVYDLEKGKFYHEDFEGKPIDYEDEVMKLLNELDKENKQLKHELEEAKGLIAVLKEMVLKND